LLELRSNDVSYIAPRTQPLGARHCDPITEGVVGRNLLKGSRQTYGISLWKLQVVESWLEQRTVSRRVRADEATTCQHPQSRGRGREPINDPGITVSVLGAIARGGRDDNVALPKNLAELLGLEPTVEARAQALQTSEVPLVRAYDIQFVAGTNQFHRLE
jgi:hypothetical protein